MPSGVVMPYWSDRPPGETLEIALNAERFGYREIWMGEMLHFDGFALAGALAAQTSNATITVGPLPVGLRDPVGLAMGIASIGVLGGRPARLALGASSPAVVDGWHGHAWDGNPARMEEAVALIRSVLRGERTDHHGVYFRSRGFRSGLGPQPSHITLAALGPRALAAADRCADRIVMNLVPSEQVAKVTPSITRPLAVWLVAGVDPSAEGWRQVRRQIALYLAAPGYSQVLTAAGLGEVVE
ncbi:MAG: LLM class F420-dependent oxidoreductase, partial [Acidimicrobiia bacterium]